MIGEIGALPKRKLPPVEGAWGSTKPVVGLLLELRPSRPRWPRGALERWQGPARRFEAFGSAGVRISRSPAHWGDDGRAFKEMEGHLGLDLGRATMRCHWSAALLRNAMSPNGGATLARVDGCGRAFRILLSQDALYGYGRV